MAFKVGVFQAGQVGDTKAWGYKSQRVAPEGHLWRDDTPALPPIHQDYSLNVPLTHPLLSSSLSTILVQGSSYWELPHYNSLLPSLCLWSHLLLPAVARVLWDPVMPFTASLPHL